jgi:hypothetical protein
LESVQKANEEQAVKNLKELYYKERKEQVEAFLQTIQRNELEEMQTTFLNSQIKNLFFMKAYRQ